MSAADAVEQKQVLVGRTSAGDVGKRRLRDLVLVGVRANSVFSHDVGDDLRSAAESLERLLRAGYRYFEFEVRQHNGLFHWSADGCSSVTVRDEISPALVALASFSKKVPADVFVVRFVLESRSQPEGRVLSGYRLLETISTCIGSRSVTATRVFESTVDEMLSSERNIVVLVKDLSSMLPSNATDRYLLHPGLPDIFVEDNTARNKTDVSAWNVVDRGGSVLEQHRSVDTLSVLTLNWQDSDVSTTSSLFSDMCRPLYWLLMVVGALMCWLVTRLGVGRRSAYRTYGCLAAVSAVTTTLLAGRIISSGSSPSVTVSNVQLVNTSCAAVVIAARHWVARPTRYRLNVFIVDHRKYCCGCACSTTPTSGAAGLATLANAGRIRRQVTLTHAGSSLSDSFGLRAIFACPSVLFAYVVTSRDEGHVVAWNQLSDGDVVDFEEGQFPMDATVAIYVATVWNRWLHVSFTVTPDHVVCQRHSV